MFAACLTSHWIDIPPEKHLAYGCVEVTAVGLTRCQYFPAQCISSWEFPCSPLSLRETKCKMLTLKQRSQLPGDTKGSPSAWSSEPFVVSWVTTTATTAATGQAALQCRWLAQRLILCSPLKSSLDRKQSPGRCIPRREGHLLHLSAVCQKTAFPFVNQSSSSYRQS